VRQLNCCFPQASCTEYRYREIAIFEHLSGNASRMREAYLQLLACFDAMIDHNATPEATNIRQSLVEELQRKVMELAEE
jgi:hypothetical protein